MVKVDDRNTTVNEARFESLLDTAADGIIVMDERGRMLVFNKICETMFGYSSEEAVGKPVNLIMPPEFSTDHDRYVRNYHRTGEKRIIGIGREVSGMHKDGTVFPLELSVGEAVTPEGRQYIGVLRDLRPRRAVEVRVSQLQAQVVHMTRLSAMDEMGAAMAHELNQPLTALLLYLQAVTRQIKNSHAEGQVPSEKVLGVLDKAVTEAERASHIVQRMRQMVEKRDPERATIDLREVVNEALDLSEFVAQSATVTIRRVYGPNPIWVDADATQIQQIVLNLLRNALEVAKESEERWVKVSIGSDDRSAVVSVTDSGPGFSEEVSRSLFKTFSTTKKSGMGLGLAISRAIAQNHGGDLMADSGGSGQGATFTLVLPVHRAAVDEG
ncbi:two-component system sensor histidine kinase NtrB [Oryzibacter oryziterrae]|uniref:two-component system sensor histidine kinase NtrB n=1 Tax=Oryzibacter oryziterrae TaxID=2766474 RepID=UPI001F34A508|nr:PAS domain S-box protein [Oryzibacter oryziterrae]